MSPEKWPGQKKTVPIAAPPKGMWYDPEVKESASQHAPSINDAIKFFIQNPSAIGKPAFIDVPKRSVELDNGRHVSFEDIMTAYQDQVTKTSEHGFFDSPTDVGKDPKGDFPSVKWLPRGQEDAEENPNIVTAEQKENTPDLSDKMMKDMVPMFVEDTDPSDHKCATCFMRVKTGEGDRGQCTIVDNPNGISFSKGTCAFWAKGEASKDADIAETRLNPDTAGYYETKSPDDKVNCATCRHYDIRDNKGYCTLWAGTVEPEQCCMVWEPGSKNESSKKARLSKFDKRAYEEALPLDYEKQIAAKWGPEYISALYHYRTAVENGHDKTRALQYAVAEMKKVDTTIIPEKLLEVANVYMKLAQ